MFRTAFLWFAASGFAYLFIQPLNAAQVLRGHIPSVARQAVPQGSVASDRVLRLAIGLPLRDQEGLNRLLTEIYDPQHPNYHKYLTADEFAERFGPTRENYAAVIAYLRENGLTVTATHPNRVLLQVKGTVGQIEKVFKLNLRLYRHPKESRLFFAPDTEPTLNLGVPVLHISGLDDFRQPRPLHREVNPNRGPTRNPVPLVGSGPNGSYMGRDFRVAYAEGVSLTGAGQYVGLLQFDGYNPSDIAAYTAQAGLTNVPLINVLLDGVTGAPGINNVEVALDIEMAISMAPGLSGVIVYEGDFTGNGNDILNRMATDNIAKQLSASWGGFGDSTTSQIFQQFAAQGQSFFNASGDDGAYSGFIDEPSDSPYITSVGGTVLSTDGPEEAWTGEVTWSWWNSGQGASATGGGISPDWPLPNWQQGINMTTNHGSTTNRNIPDVAMVADNVLVRANNGQTLFVGGTSIASPLWAGYIALVNQQAARVGQPPAGFINPAIYAMAKTTNYSSLFHDIKIGNNTNSSSPNQFYATPGYDLCTGLGTPKGKAFINALAPLPSGPYVVAFRSQLGKETCSQTNGVLDPGEAVSMHFYLQNLGSVPTTNLVATLQSSNGVSVLSDPQSYSALAANGSPGGRVFSFIVNGACGDTVTLTLELQDGPLNLGTVSFVQKLGKPQLILTQNFDTVTVPMLPSGWARLATSGVSNWVATSASADTGTNSVCVSQSTARGVSELYSPTFSINSSSAQVVFKNYFNTEVDVTDPLTAYDGGVLEINIADNGFVDIIDTGGSFVSGGYNRVIDSSGDNPLAGRNAWGGLSPGFVTTTVNLPAIAAGQEIQLKWRFGTDNGSYYGGSGWCIDSVSVIDGYSCCTPAANNDLSISQSAAPNPSFIGQAVTYSVSVSNLGPAPAPSLIITDTLPSSVTFLSASPGCTNLGGVVVCGTPLLVGGDGTNFSIQVSSTNAGMITNVVFVSSANPDTNFANNLTTNVTSVSGAPFITTQPANQVVIASREAAFTVGASGTGPLSYQWMLWGTNLPGANAATLYLPGVQPSQAGPYSVVVTNDAGMTNSDSAMLRVLVPPVIQSNGLVISPTNVSISLSSVVGLSYVLEYKNSLDDTTWIPVPPPIQGNGSTVILRDTNSPSAFSRYYRVNCF